MAKSSLARKNKKWRKRVKKKMGEKANIRVKLLLQRKEKKNLIIRITKSIYLVFKVTKKDLAILFSKSLFSKQ